jgi:RimJ/RimL family protein N-acetyltransferase
MHPEMNELGQPIGFVVPNWIPASRPASEPMEGRFCRLEPLNAGHAAELWEAFSLDREGRGWTYLFDGPYEDFGAFENWVSAAVRRQDSVFFAIRELQNGRAAGIASYLRIAPEAGSIEVGNLHFSPLLQQTPAATEAMFLMMRNAFALGYRRYEWKCNALNEPSRRAAERLGFTFEGIFRQALVVKGRNRDTAWFSILNSEWPEIQAAFLQWLAPENFDAEGRQRRSLGEMMRAARKTPGGADG